MKRLLCLSLTLLAAVSLSFSQDKAFTLRAFLPIDFVGTFTSSDPNVKYPASVNYDTNMGFGIGAEAMYDVKDGLRLGAGFQLGIDRGVDFGFADYNPKFSFIPIYGILAYFSDLGSVNPYSIARVGYDFHEGNDDYKLNDDLTGGVYFSIGGGADVKIASSPVDVFVELDYAYDGGGYDQLQYDVSYKRIQLCIGAAYAL